MNTLPLKCLKEESNNAFTLRDFFYYFHHSELLKLNIYIHVEYRSRLDPVFEGRMDDVSVNPSGNVPIFVGLYLDCPVIVVDYFEDVFTIVLACK